MKAYIVCEGELDATLLQHVLPEPLLNNVGIVAAGSLSSAKSMARSLVVRRQVPVAIVVDAETVNPDQVEERRREVKEIVESVAPNTAVEVILAVPAIEAIFFQDSSLLPRLLSSVLSQEILSLAVYQPQQALTQLMTQSKKRQNESWMIEQLADEDLEILRKASVIKEIIQFLQSVQETADAA
jgi:hypothetical protein